MIDLPSPALIGVIHLKPLPGAPGHHYGMDELIGLALADARALESAGFDAAIVENFGDRPFSAGRMDAASTAAMAVIADRIKRETRLTIGINALRNDALSALAIAAATGASFIRVNVHVGVYAADQGFIEGKADQTLRYRNLLGARAAVLADVGVKHAHPVSEPDIARAAKDTAYRGLADGLIVTGRATGEAADMTDLQRVREAVPDRRLFVGSGVTSESVAEVLKIATGVIVGSSLKEGNDPDRPIDSQRAAALARAAGRG